MAGSAALFLSLEIAIAIAILLAVVSTSYRQIGYAYPQGGGAYAVARANLGRSFALVAAAALLVDYILTVSVSTSSAVEQLTSAFPDLRPEAVLIGVTVIGLMTLGNLRGLRESGNIFAVPTYLFVGSALLMIAIGMYRVVVLGEGVPPAEIVEGTIDLTQAAGIMLLLRAFSAGSVALTGTEAIANGVQAFKPPEPRNAAATLTAMAILLAILFIGITFVADCVRPCAPRRSDHGPRLADHRRPGRVDHLRQRLDRLLPLPGVHGADPLPGRQHRLQRLPAAGRHPRPGRLHAPPVLVPWRPTGLQPGHRRARRRGRRAGRHLRRRDAPRSSRSTRSASS